MVVTRADSFVETEMATAESRENIIRCVYARYIELASLTEVGDEDGDEVGDEVGEELGLLEDCLESKCSQNKIYEPQQETSSMISLPKDLQWATWMVVTMADSFVETEMATAESRKKIRCVVYTRH